MKGGEPLDANISEPDQELFNACFNVNRKINESGENVLDKALNASGVNVNAKDKHGQTPLHVACKRGNKDAVLKLIDKGANVNAIDKDDSTPLHEACWGCARAEDEPKESDVEMGIRKAIIDLLIKAGADVNAKDKHERTPLIIADRWDCDYIADVLQKKIDDEKKTENNTSDSSGGRKNLRVRLKGVKPEDVKQEKH